MPFTEEDEQKMGAIADATLAADIAELREMLADNDLIHRLMVSGNRQSDPILEDRLDLMINHLEFLLSVVKDRLHKA